MSVSRLMKRQCLAGLIFVAVGGLALVQAMHYPAGTVRRMGPGFFPLIVATLMVACGAVAVLQGLLAAEPDVPERVRLRTLALLTAAIVAFGMLVERAGLVAAIFGLVLLACAPRLRTGPVEVLALFLVLSGLIVGVFVHALGLPIAAF